MTHCSGIMENKMETIIMENQMEKKMENEMEYIGVIYYSSFHFLFHSPNIGVSLNYGYFLGVPIIRIIVYWGLYWGPLILRNYPITPIS